MDWLEDLVDLAPDCPAGARVAVAMSGGRDSQALFHYVASRAETLRLGALLGVGIDHGLRPEATAELDLAETLCHELGRDFERIAVAVQPGNVADAARNARYRALDAFADRARLDRILLAHTQTDQCETLLLNLIRGAGLRGAGAMAKVRGSYRRPLLGVSRDQTTAYCGRFALAFADDPGNDSGERARSRLRHDVFPVLRTLNPQAERALAQFAADARRDEAALEAIAESLLERWAGSTSFLAPTRALPLEELRDLAPAILHRVLRRILEDHGVGVNRRRIGRLRGMVHAGRGRWATDAANFACDRGHLFATPLARTDSSPTLLGSGATRLPPWNVNIALRRRSRRDPEEFLQASRGVAFDDDKLHGPLFLRTWKPGDSFACFGLSGRKSVGDLFTDCKIPRPLRTLWPVVTDRKEEVAWVVGLRRAELAPIGETTRRVVELELAGALSVPKC